MPDETRGAPGDAELLARLRRGDESAFDDLVRLYRRDVYRLAYRLTGDPGEADDLAQETFLRAYQAIGGFRGEAALRTWLMRIAGNLGINVIQSARVSRRDLVDVEAAAPPAPPVAESGMLEREKMKALGPAIDALPPRQRATLILRVTGGLKFKEIAAAMGCTTGTAKANFFHAVAALRRSLKDWAS
jgi:RNA polymerase sigma-70 factor (ECF subfamily)